jgi:hypothetical protein
MMVKITTGEQQRKLSGNAVMAVGHYLSQVP